jgi:uroporphyrinogen-III synthase
MAPEPEGGAGSLAGLHVVALEARRATELRRLLERHGATVESAPALRERALDDAPAAVDLGRRLAAGEVALLVLTTGVGTKALAAVLAPAHADLPALLARTRIVARGPKPLAALRELGVAGAVPVPSPNTWREVLGVVDGLGLAAGSLVAVQEYGTRPVALVDGLGARGFRALSVPVYRWALPDDPAPLRAAAATLAAGHAQVLVLTSAVQIEHLFRVAPDPHALRKGLARTVVASIGPVCSESAIAHGIPPDLEADPPKLGILAALVADRAAALVAAKRSGR